MNRRIAFVLCFCAAGLTLILSNQSVRAQTKSNEDASTVQSLLTEVRLLRRTLQRNGLNAYRTQIIVEGIRAHDDKVVRLTRQVEEVRDEINRIESTIPRMTEQGKLLEGLIEQEPDQVKRIRMEFETKDMKRSIEQYKIRLERQREREIQLSAQLRTEQSKLEELEGRLDALEREIQIEVARQQQEDTQEGKKRP